MMEVTAPPNGRLPDLAIESVARGFFREADKYGFGLADYLRFVNRVLGMSMSRTGNGSAQAALVVDVPRPDPSAGLPLRGEAVCIRAFDRAADSEVFERWMQDEMGSMFLLATSMTRKLALDDVLDDPGSLIGMITLPDSTPIGATAFLNVDREQGKAELRKLIGEPSMRRRGYAKAATRLWIEFGLGALGLHKIYLNTLDTNLRNIRLNESLGFRLEGILHDEVFLDGGYRDVLRMAIWNGERGGDDGDNGA